MHHGGGDGTRSHGHTGDVGRRPPGDLWRAAYPPPPSPPLTTPNVSSLQKKERDTTIELLQQHFHRPLAAVSAELQVCMTLIKRVMRKHGITRWPYRKVISNIDMPPQSEDALILTALVFGR